jgi:hypothetical protein
VALLCSFEDVTIGTVLATKTTVASRKLQLNRYLRSTNAKFRSAEEDVLGGEEENYDESTIPGAGEEYEEGEEGGYEESTNPEAGDEYDEGEGVDGSNGEGDEDGAVEDPLVGSNEEGDNPEETKTDDENVGDEYDEKLAAMESSSSEEIAPEEPSEGTEPITTRDGDSTIADHDDQYFDVRPKVPSDGDDTDVADVDEIPDESGAVDGDTPGSSLDTDISPFGLGIGPVILNTTQTESSEESNEDGSDGLDVDGTEVEDQQVNPEEDENEESVEQDANDGDLDEPVEGDNVDGAEPEEGDTEGQQGVEGQDDNLTGEEELGSGVDGEDSAEQYEDPSSEETGNGEEDAYGEAPVDVPASKHNIGGDTYENEESIPEDESSTYSPPSEENDPLTQEEAEEKQQLDGGLTDGNPSYSWKEKTPAEMAALAQEEAHNMAEDKYVRLVIILASIAAVALMLVVAQQMIENPNGFLAKFCRCMVGVVRFIILPIRMILCCELCNKRAHDRRSRAVISRHDDDLEFTM